jgi:molecular chaperone GrpE
VTKLDEGTVNQKRGTDEQTPEEELVQDEQEQPFDNFHFLNSEQEEEGDNLESMLAGERARIDELIDQLQRERAELINYRRRKEQEQEVLRVRAIESALSKILPVADDLHRAVKTLPVEAEGNSWAEGFKLIEANLRRALEAQGVTVMESVGKPFDPNKHEAVMFDENTSGEHMVVEEFQRGYLIHDKVLRPAMVKVGSISTDNDDE